jgi:hypothetical protein
MNKSLLIKYFIVSTRELFSRLQIPISATAEWAYLLSMRNYIIQMFSERKVNLGRSRTRGSVIYLTNKFALNC